MKKLLVTTLIVAFSAGTAMAGDGTRGGGKGMQRGGNPEQRMQRMQEHLDLSETQMEQLREIRENGGGREEMSAVFTDEQRAKIEERRAARKERGGDRNRPPGKSDEEYN